MKKLLIILITIPFIFNSCKKDEQTICQPIETPNLLLGNWDMKSEQKTISGYLLNNQEIITDSTIYTSPNNNENIKWNFSDEGIYTYSLFLNDSLINTRIHNYTMINNVITLDTVIDMQNGIVYSGFYNITTLSSDSLHCFSEGRIIQWESQDTTYFFNITDYKVRLSK
jgi:hypothetical protein